MLIVAGLGNPEKKYEGTRHNVGFEAIDYVAERLGIDVNQKKFKGLVGEGVIDGKKAILLKPMTYMNLSGESIKAACDFYKADPKTDFLVISDDVALSAGNIRVRKKGSAGGHNGLKNIIFHLGTEEFARIRIGVGECTDGNLIGHVLGRYDADDRQKVDESFEKVLGALNYFAAGDLDASMNKYNVKERNAFA